VQVAKLSKLVKKRRINGYVYTRDGQIKVFVPPGTEYGRIRTLVGYDVEIEEGVFHLMSANTAQPISDAYARAWCISKDCRCSPPLSGFTCHHCASKDNSDSTGAQGYLFKTPYNIDVDSTVKVVKDFPFQTAGWKSLLMAILCRLFSIPDFCNYGVNKFDFAKLDYDVRAPDMDKYAAIIFAGMNQGPYAVAYPFANLPDQYRPSNIINPSEANQLIAYTMHCDTWGTFGTACPVVRRTYAYYGSGVVNVYAYNTFYTFSDAVFLTATDTPLIIQCCGDTKLVTWAVQPGYSGSVVGTPVQRTQPPQQSSQPQ